MNLLTEAWIPVRPLPAWAPEKITLRRLLCEDEKWELSLPRDDMELAALQMLVCMVQVFFIPKDTGELKKRITAPLLPEEFDAGCAPYKEWFRLDHPDFPFMQVRGVKAKEPTPMDKLLAGVTGATNSCFVNEPGLGTCLCGGCAAIALFNQSNNAPGFGGGFKGSLRGGAPVTTLVQGDHLRQTIWLNVLDESHVDAELPWHRQTLRQAPTWVEPIKAGATIPAQTIGLLRGLFWQPAHIELLPPDGEHSCSCCGFVEKEVYRGFNKAKFNFTVTDLWPHPHGARITTVKSGVPESKFVSFTTTAPAWTQLSRFVVQQQLDDGVQGQLPAAVVRQAQGLIRSLRLNVGGYRNNQASILDRRHETIFLNDGWSNRNSVVHDFVGHACGYRDALNKALYVFAKGLKETKGTAKVKGAGVSVQETAREQFYRRTEDTVLDTLANMDFINPVPTLLAMGVKLHKTVTELFESTVQPYLNDPELVRTMAVSRKTLRKHLKALKPQQDGRKDDGTNG